MSQKISLKIKRLPHAGDLPLPKYQTEHAAGMDLMAAVDGEVVVGPGLWALVPTGLAVEIPPGYEAQIRPRSGLALKHGIGLVNAPGTIDADYRGEVGVILINFGPAPFVIRRGDRIAQMVLGRVYQADVEVTEDLSATDRHDGGFGHTGHK